MGLGSSLKAQLLNCRDQFGERPAVVYDSSAVTHNEFAGCVDRLALGLKNCGVAAQDRVAIFDQNSLDYLQIYGACEASGVILVTVNFRLAAPEIAHILADSSPKLIFCGLSFKNTLTDALTIAGMDVPVVYLPEGSNHEVVDILAAARSASNKVKSGQIDPASSDLAYLLYTSGTTGRPKGCMLSHGALVQFAEKVASGLAASSEDRALVVMPLFHIGAKAVQLALHRVGGSIVLHRSFDIEQMLAAIEEHRVTILHLAPVMLQAFLDHPKLDKFDLSSIRLILYSAAPMPERLLRKGLERLGPVFVQMYGQTEGIGTLLPAADHKLDGPDMGKRLLSIGLPFPGVELKIADDEDHEIPAGETGEILLRTSAAFSGYWNNAEASVKTLRGGWLHTGDLGQVDEDGYLYLVDRKKDMIISGGENIYSREVEDALLAHDDIAEAAVIGVADPKWGEAVCAIIAVKPQAVVNDDQVAAHCRVLIAAYKCPKRVVRLEVLPKLASGKTDKVQLRRLYGLTQASMEAA
jgi:acyl-CoA synthetase (AMP-forming)/AMP-acid ligase II